jgi:hypothetical protein
VNGKECTLFSEELKYAQSLGYTILPVSGYLFEKMDSPFHSYVNNLYECRLGAKKAGNKSMAFVYLENAYEFTVWKIWYEPTK